MNDSSFNQLERPLFLLTIDLEEEWQWNGKFPSPSFYTKNIEEVPDFRKSCDVLGIRPTYSYRALRRYVNGVHLQVLANASYKVDSRVRPFYADNDFSCQQAFTHPYWPSCDDALKIDEAQRSLMEVPTSSGFDRTNFEFLNNLHMKLSTPPLHLLRFIGILWRLRILRKITVTPEGNEADDVCRCIDACLARGGRIVNMFFHSSNLLPGFTPYVQNAAEKQRFLDSIKRCAEHVRTIHNAEFVTMRKARQRLTGAT